MSLGHRRQGAGTRSTITRSLGVVCAAAVFAWAWPAAAQPAPFEVTDDAVVAAALGEQAFEDFSAAAGLARDAEALRLSAWPSPRVGFGYERLGAGAEATWVLQQPLRLSGRHTLMADAARVLAESDRIAADARRLGHARAIRAEFYHLLEAQARVEVFEAWLAVMARVDEDLGRRVAAGESAPYDRLRVQRELADIGAQAARARGARDARRVHLARLLDLAPQRAEALRARGELMPAPPPADASLTAAVLRRPDIAAAAARARAADLLRAAADRAWVPEPQLEAGYITADAPSGREHGFVAGVSLNLPLGARADAQRKQAQAMKLEADGHAQFAIHHVTAEVLGLAHQIRALTRVAADYESQGIAAAAQLVETARLAYAAGELGILELIDAHRGLVEARLTLLEMAAEAREHDIELWHELANPAAEVQP